MNAPRCFVRAVPSFGVGGTFVEDATHLHTHFLRDDAGNDAAGEAMSELCCHACHRALIVRFDWPPPASADGVNPVLYQVRSRFFTRHQRCPSPVPHAVDFRSYCPAQRRDSDYLDLRGCRLHAAPQPQQKE